jgi:hypothetical protein
MVICGRWWGGILCGALCGVSAVSYAQEYAAPADALAQANNPLANFTAFNVHDYYIGDLTDVGEDANQAWARFAKPFTIGESSWIMRASLPLNTYPVPPQLSHRTGIGDMNVFAAYLIDTGNPTLAFGIGPQITTPTASEDALGSGQWSGGLVNTLFSFASPVFQYGYLLSWQASFAGDDDRSDVNVGGFQPFLFYQLGGGLYLRSSAVMTYNFESDTYSVPIGLGIGKVFQSEKVVFNLFAEPQLSLADKGPGWPEWQVFVGLNSQFK